MRNSKPDKKKVVPYHNQYLLTNVCDTDFPYISNFCPIQNKTIPWLAKITENGWAALLCIYLMSVKYSEDPYAISPKFISEELGLDIKTVQAAMRRLLDCKILRRIPDDNGNPTRNLCLYITPELYESDGPHTAREAAMYDKNVRRKRRSEFNRMSNNDAAEAERLAQASAEIFADELLKYQKSTGINFDPKVRPEGADRPPIDLE